MSDTPPVQEAEESAPIPLNPEDEPALNEVASAAAQAKANEARLRKVSSAYKQLQGEMQAMRERHLRTREDDQRLMKAQVVKSLFEPLLCCFFTTER